MSKKEQKPEGMLRRGPAPSPPHQKQIFVGKLNGELWASKKIDLRTTISTGILGRVGREGFLGSSVATQRLDVW